MLSLLFFQARLHLRWSLKLTITYTERLVFNRQLGCAAFSQVFSMN